MPLDIASNRASVRYSRSENARRILWACAWPLFRLSPRPCFGWRRLLLRLFGARIGQHVHVYPTTSITMPWNLELGDWASLGEQVFVYNLGPLTIGAKATISLRAFLCGGSHDETRPDLPLLRLPIQIGAEAWVCADAFVGPGVVVGDGAVVAARAVVVRDVPAWSVVAGNPATVKGTRTITGEGGE